MRRLTAVICVILSAGIALTACSSDDPEATQSSIPGSPSTDHAELGSLQRMLLTESDFPAGSRYQVSANAGDYGSQLAAALKTTSFDPPACKEPREEQARFNAKLERAGAVAVTDTGQQYQTAVTSEGAEPISLAKRMFFGDCADVTRERSINGQVVTITRQRGSDVEQPPGIRADESFVYLLTNDVQSTLPGDTSPVSHEYRLTGNARVGGISVWIEQAVSDRDKLDIPQFMALFKAAIEKIR